MNPLLLTLYGANKTDPRLGWIGTVITAAISNIIGDITGIASGKENIKTGILNTLFPYIGKYVGGRLWSVDQSSQASASVPAQSLADLSAKKQQTIAMVATVIPFAGALIYQLVKRG